MLDWTILLEDGGLGAEAEAEAWFRERSPRTIKPEPSYHKPYLEVHG